VFCETNVYYTNSVKETYAYRQAKHHEHFYIMPLMIYISSQNSSDSTCAVCHTANVDAAVHLLPHVWTSVAGDGLQHWRSSCDKRETHRAPV